MNTIKNTRGQALLYVLVTAGIMEIAMLAFVSMQSSQRNMILNNQVVITRNILQLRTDRYMRDKGSLAVTLADQTNPGNIALNDCLKAAPNCIAVAAQGFSLYDASGVKITGAGNVAPLRYDTDGTQCLTASSRCIFEISTTYTAICPGGTSPCANPSVKAQYSIRQAPGVTPAGGTPLKAFASPDVPLTASVAVGGCTVGQKVMGLDPSGQQICMVKSDVGSVCTPLAYPNARGLVAVELLDPTKKCCVVYGVSIVSPPYYRTGCYPY